MSFLFAMVVVQRHRILSQWWVHQLRKTTDAGSQAYYVACLAAMGDDAASAIAKLGQEPQSEIRALIIPASQGLSGRRRFELLRLRLSDRDYEIRLSTATALAFLELDFTHDFLVAQMNSPAPEVVTAAAAGLARLTTQDAMNALCDAASSHLSSWVRAQAIESLGQQLVSNATVAATSRPAGDETFCDPLTVLVKALVDQDRFSRRLALETEIAHVSRALAASRGILAETPSSQTSDQRRTVAEIAAITLSTLTGQSIEPRTGMSDEEQAQLVQKCRSWLSGQRGQSPNGIAPH